MTITGTDQPAAKGAMHAGTVARAVAPVRLPQGVAAAMAFALLLAACCGPARADDAATADRKAQTLVEEVLRRSGAAGEDGLGEWTRAVLGRALERAAEATRETGPGTRSPAPLPAERQAGATARGLAARGTGAEVVVFMSLAVPAAGWREWAGEAARIGAPLVLRGVAPAGFRATVREVGRRLGGHDAGVAIDPRLFRLFGIERAPAVIVVPGGVPACSSRGCSDDPAPPHDLVAGNIGLAAALEAVAAEGDVGRAVAGRRLAALRGDER